MQERLRVGSDEDGGMMEIYACVEMETKGGVEREGGESRDLGLSIPYPGDRPILGLGLGSG